MMMFGMRDSGSKDNKIESLILRPGTRILRPGLLLAGLLGLSFVAAACTGVESDDMSGSAGKMIPESIGGQLYSDGNGDGEQGEGEEGIGGVEVRLLQDFDGDGACDREIASTMTDQNGNFVFENVAPGSYCIAHGDFVGEVFEFEGGSISQSLGVRP